MINTRYVLFNSTPLLLTEHGRYLCDPFWAKELKRHIAYIADLHLCCPIIKTTPESDMEQLKKTVSYNFGELEDITDYQLKILPLAYCKGWLAVFKNFIPNFLKVKNALSPNCIAHSDCAGWPFPISYYLLPLKLFKSFTWITVLESTFFLMNKGDRFNLRKFFSHHLHSLLIPLCLKAADARLFTHLKYKNLFLKNIDENVYIFQYSMIDDEFFTNEEAIQSRLKNIEQRKVRLIMAGRLVHEKGVTLLLNAIEKLREKNIEAEINIMGSGPLESACRELAAKPQGSITMAFIEPIAYGRGFYEYLSTYDFLMLPNLSEEQPRIIFDSFGQGMSIIASETEGLVATCKHGENAIIFKRGDLDSLCEAIESVVSDKSKIITLGVNGLNYAKSRTHQRMHQDREKFLKDVMNII